MYCLQVQPQFVQVEIRSGTGAIQDIVGCHHCKLISALISRMILPFPAIAFFKVYGFMKLLFRYQPNFAMIEAS